MLCRYMYKKNQQQLFKEERSYAPIGIYCLKAGETPEYKKNVYLVNNAK